MEQTVGGFSVRHSRIIAILAAIAAVLAAVRVFIIGSHYPFDYNEGWNAFHAQIAVSGQALYPGSDALTTTNYPPLSFYLIGVLGRLVPDLIVVGRIVALLSATVVGWCIFRIVRAFGTGPAGPLAGLALFAMINATAFRGYLAMNDPQWLGQAFMAGALLLLVTGSAARPLATLTTVAAALLVVVGISVKHNIVAIPAACTLWLLLNDRRALAVWVATGAARCLALLLIDRLVFGGTMMPSILFQPRSYSAMRALGHGAVGLLFVPAGVLAVKAHPRIADRRYELVLYGLAISAVIGFVEGSGAGVDINAWFELLIFGAIAFGIALPVLAGEKGFAWKFRFGIAPMVALVPYGLYLVAEDLGGRAERSAQTRAIVAQVAAVDGKVACDMLAYCYWAGEDYGLDFFQVGQRAATATDSAELEQHLAAGDFAAFLMGDWGTAPPPGPVQAFALQHHYQPAFRDAGTVLYRRD